MLHMCICMYSHFIENHSIRILEDGPLISEVVLSQTIKVKIQNSRTGWRDSGPTCRFVTSPEVGWGPLSVPCRLGTPYTGLSPRQGAKRTAICPIALDSASLLGRAPALPRVPLHRILPPCLGGLWRYHVSHSIGPHLPGREGFGAGTRPTDLDPRLPAREGSGVVTCLVAPNPTSLHERDLALPHVPRISVGHIPQE
jgi:hypothetical protein